MNARPWRRCLLALAGGALSAAQALAGGTAFSGADAERLYAHKCAVCHASGPLYPGYLALKARGVAQPTLAERSDLNAAYVKHVARNGLNSMPMFTPIQLPEAELDAITAWLVRPRP